MCKISIGIDIHGCLDTIPDTLKEIMCSLICRKNNVYIITGIPFVHVKQTLDDLLIFKDVHYTHFFSIEEHLLKNNNKVIGYDKKGRNIFRSLDWDMAKANYCHKHKIELMLDDSNVYGRYFSTPYAQIHV